MAEMIFPLPPSVSNFAGKFRRLRGEELFLLSL